MSSAHQVILAVIHRFFESNFKKSIVLSYDIVAADCISFAATSYASHEKSLLAHSVAAPLKIVTALLGHDFVFLIWQLIHSVRMTQKEGHANACRSFWKVISNSE